MPQIRYHNRSRLENMLPENTPIFHLAMLNNTTGKSSMKVKGKKSESINTGRPGHHHADTCNPVISGLALYVDAPLLVVVNGNIK